ncbi:MAG: hypothetical protein PG981_001445 [Wolbachia endosymbiont of Ctenocephalides orientis wCori]|nr:MAG: hypothetical protein PG981_001445 [Wolbachia endosymbiont of Ctenocephalides orientis wCori]
MHQNDATFTIKNDQVTNSGSINYSWVNSFVDWAKNSLAGFLASSTEQTNSSIAQQEVNSTLLLGIVAATLCSNRGKQHKQQPDPIFEHLHHFSNLWY